MTTAEKIFKRFFKNYKEYRKFKSKYNVQIYNDDFEERAGSCVLVLEDNGYIISFEGKPATVNVTQYVTGEDIMVAWCSHDPNANNGKGAVMVHRPIECGAAIHRYFHSDKLAVSEFYVNGEFISGHKGIVMDDSIHPVV